MDAGWRAWLAEAAVEVHVARWARGVRLRCDWRGGAAHHACFSHRFVFRRDSTLVVLCALTKEWPAMDEGGGLVIRNRHGGKFGRPGGRRFNVFALQAVPLCRAADQPSLSRPEALAPVPGSDLRLNYVHVGIQRPAVDGAF